MVPEEADILKLFFCEILCIFSEAEVERAVLSAVICGAGNSKNLNKQIKMALCAAGCSRASGADCTNECGYLCVCGPVQAGPYLSPADSWKRLHTPPDPE